MTGFALEGSEVVILRRETSNASTIRLDRVASRTGCAFSG